MSNTLAARGRAVVIALGLSAAAVSGCANQGITTPPAELAADRKVTVVDSDTIRISVEDRLRRNTSFSMQMLDGVSENAFAGLLLAAAGEARARGFDQFALYLEDHKVEGSVWSYNATAKKIKALVGMYALVELGQTDPAATWSGGVAQAEQRAVELTAK